jgi:F-type H+-transporting ATPase subunit b
MQQLFGAFGINLSLLIAQLLNFGVLLIALWYLLYKPVMRTIDERQKKIAQGVEDAELAATKLAGADEQVITLVRTAEVEADGIMASARDAGTVEKNRIVTDAQARAAAIEADADARAKETAAKTLRDSEKEVARLAILAAEKVMRTAS